MNPGPWSARRWVDEKASARAALVLEAQHVPFFPQARLSHTPPHLASTLTPYRTRGCSIPARCRSAAQGSTPHRQRARPRHLPRRTGDEERDQRRVHVVERGVVRAHGGRVTVVVQRRVGGVSEAKICFRNLCEREGAGVSCTRGAAQEGSLAGTMERRGGAADRTHRRARRLARPGRRA